MISCPRARSSCLYFFWSSGTWSGNLISSLTLSRLFSSQLQVHGGMLETWHLTGILIDTRSLSSSRHDKRSWERKESLTLSPEGQIIDDWIIFLVVIDRSDLQVCYERQANAGHSYQVNLTSYPMANFLFLWLNAMDRKGFTSDQEQEWSLPPCD